jgi:hypothetical protein
MTKCILNINWWDSRHEVRSQNWITSVFWQKFWVFIIYTEISTLSKLLLELILYDRFRRANTSLANSSVHGIQAVNIHILSWEMILCVAWVAQRTVLSIRSGLLELFSLKEHLCYGAPNDLTNYKLF